MPLGPILKTAISFWIEIWSTVKSSANAIAFPSPDEIDSELKKQAPKSSQDIKAPFSVRFTCSALPSKSNFDRKTGLPPEFSTYLSYTKLKNSTPN